EQVAAGAEREQRGAERGGARGEVTVDDAREERGGGGHGERGEELRAERGGERGREQRVREQVVPAVPRVVPQREAGAREEFAAIGGGGEVRAGGRDDEIHNGERGGEDPRAARASRERVDPPVGERGGEGPRAGRAARER